MIHKILLGCAVYLALLVSIPVAGMAFQDSNFVTLSGNRAGATAWT